MAFRNAYTFKNLSPTRDAKKIKCNTFKWPIVVPDGPNGKPTIGFKKEYRIEQTSQEIHRHGLLPVTRNCSKGFSSDRWQHQSVHDQKVVKSDQKINTIIVNSNGDFVDSNNKLTTLREAINQINSSPAGIAKHEIVFAQCENKSSNDYANSNYKSNEKGYWIIQLQKSLPAIKKGIVSINNIRPQSVTLVPKDGNSLQGSMMTIGDYERTAILSGKQILLHLAPLQVGDLMKI